MSRSVWSFLVKKDLKLVWNFLLGKDKTISFEKIWKLFCWDLGGLIIGRFSR